MSDDRRIELPVLQGFSRRAAVKTIGAAVGVGALARALSPLAPVLTEISGEEYLRRHYADLDSDQHRAMLDRASEEASARAGRPVLVKDPQPLPGVKFVYAINLSLCNGSGKCVEACHRENNHDRTTNQSYIRVMEVDKGSLGLAGADSTYDHPVPAPGKFYIPVQCQQCDNPPCTRVCPVEATWKQEDGIVVVDYDWCIGCRYCEAACPYHARRFNWNEPEVPEAEINSEQGYFSNRLRPRGVMEKCHFCLHRTREGRLPACLEACPTGARVFGNVLDEKSEIRWILEHKRVFVLKEELGTRPSFFYFFDK